MQDVIAHNETALRLEKTSLKNSATAKIYQLHWSEYFPLNLEVEGLNVTLGTYDETVDFLKTNIHEVQRGFPPSAFLSEETSEARRRYYLDFGDFFTFKDRNKPIGVFVGTPIDWSSYYLRYCFILPEYQGKKIYQKLLLHLLMALRKHGVDRVETEVSPSNLRNIHVFNKLQFNISGTLLSERWGAILHFTKFLSQSHEKVFLDQFCHGVRPQVQNPL